MGATWQVRPCDRVGLHYDHTVSQAVYVLSSTTDLHNLPRRGTKGIGRACVEVLCKSWRLFVGLTETDTKAWSDRIKKLGTQFYGTTLEKDCVKETRLRSKK